MKDFAQKENLKIGGLLVAEMAQIPFKSSFFDIASAIGVFEYYGEKYIRRSLKELNRVLKQKARAVVDIPNIKHRLIETMFSIEKHLGRPNMPMKRTSFEKALTGLFSIEKTDTKRVMIKYFLKRI